MLPGQEGNVPIEGPLQQELPRGLGEAGAALVVLENLGDNVIKPAGPLVQRALLL